MLNTQKIKPVCSHRSCKQRTKVLTKLRNKFFYLIVSRTHSSSLIMSFSSSPLHQTRRALRANKWCHVMSTLPEHCCRRRPTRQSASNQNYRPGTGLTAPKSVTTGIGNKQAPIAAAKTTNLVGGQHQQHKQQPTPPPPLTPIAHQPAHQQTATVGTKTAPSSTTPIPTAIKSPILQQQQQQQPSLVHVKQTVSATTRASPPVTTPFATQSSTSETTMSHDMVNSRSFVSPNLLTQTTEKS